MKCLWTSSKWAALGVVIALQAVPDVSHAADIRWKAAVSGSWSTATNWDLGRVPGASDNAIVDVTGAAYAITINTTASVASLSVTSPNASMRLNGQTLTVAGPSVMRVSELRNATINGAGPLEIAGSFTMYQTVTVNPPLTTTGSIALEAYYPQHAVLNAVAGLTNTGTITLRTTHVDYAPRLRSSGTILNQGTIVTNSAYNGTRYIEATFVNEGTVTANGGLWFAKVNGVHVNRGTFTVASGKRVYLTAGGQTFEQAAGTLSGAAQTTGATFRTKGGAFNGTAYMTSSTLDGQGGSSGTFIMYNACAFRGNVNAGQLVQVHAYYPVHATLTAANGFTNGGTIRLTSDHVDYTATLAVTSGELLNTGRIETLAGSGGGRTITANVRNNGVVAISQNTTFNKSSGSVINAYQFTIAASRTATVASGTTFYQSGGVLTVSGGMSVSGRMNFGGGVITGNAVAMRTGGSLVISAVGQGAFYVYGSVSFSGNIAAGQSVRLQAYYPVHSVLTATAAVTNAGTITLATSHVDYIPTLRVSGGTLYNDGLIYSEATNGGQRHIDANVVNTGTVDVRAYTRLYRNLARFENQGTISIVSGGTVYIDNGHSFLHTAGELDATGTFEQHGGTFEWAGGVGTGWARLHDLTATVSGPGAFNGLFHGSNSFYGDVYPGQLMRVQGYYPVHSHLAARESFTNEGSIVLATWHVDYWAQLSLPTGGTLTNQGSITADTGSGGNRYLRGNLANQGTLNAGGTSGGTTLHFDRGGSALVNRGTVRVYSGSQLRLVASGEAYRQLEGDTILAGDNLIVSNSTVELAGGRITGGRVWGSAISITPGAGGSGAIVARGASTLTGDVAPQHSLVIQGEYPTHATLTATRAFTNAGSITLTSSHVDYFARLNGSPVTNTGTITTARAQVGGRYFGLAVTNESTGSLVLTNDTGFTTGTHVNRGAITIGVSGGRADVALSGSNFRQEGGTITFTNGSFSQSGGTVAVTGGSVVGGALVITNGALEFGDAGTASVVARGSCSLRTGVGAGHAVWVQAEFTVHSTLTATAAITNRGSISLRSYHPDYNAALSVPGTLTNAGSLRSYTQSGGARTISTQLLNTGQYYADTNTSLGRSGANHINRGLFRVVGSTTTITGAGFANETGARLRGTGTLSLAGLTMPSTGGIEPGDSGTGTLTVASGRITMQAGNTFKARIGGTAAGQWDRLTVPNVVALNGTLVLQLVNGFVPSVGQAFTLISCNTCSGRFPTVQGTELGVVGAFDIEYNSTSVVARVRQLPDFLVQTSTPTPRAGAPFDVTITARDPQDVPDPNYTGTALFSSSAPDALIPPAYQFTTTDQGRKTFINGVTFFGTGSQWLRVASGENYLVRGEIYVDVQPTDISNTRSTIAAAPTSIEANGSATSRITVTPKDRYGNRLGTGRAVVVTTTGGTLLGSVTDMGDGTYTQNVQAPLATGSGTLSATADGIALAGTATVNFVPDVTAPQAVVLSGTASGSSVVDLSWTASTSPDVNGYAVTRFEGGNAADTTPASGTTLQVSGLTSCTDYAFEVRAIDRAGNLSAASNRLALRTQLDGAPLPPANPAAMGFDGYAVLAWEPPVDCDVVRTELARSEIMGGPYTVIVPDVGNITYVDVPLVNGTTYYWVLRSVDSQDLTSPDSAEMSATPQDAPPPPPVDNLTATSRTQGRVDLAWQPAASTTPASYRIYRATAPITDVTTLTPVATVTTTTHTDQPSSDGAYHYTVTWLDIAGNESLPHPSVSAMSDRGGPSAALSIVGATAPLGIGIYTVRLVASEELSADPTLNIRLPGGTVTPLALAAVAGEVNTWEASFDVPEGTVRGNAAFTWSGTDLVGNSGTTISAGGTVVVDGIAPSASITTQPASPVRAGTVQIDVTVSESLSAAPTVTLTPSGGSAITIALAGVGTIWTGFLDVDTATGEGPAVFSFSGRDGARNDGTTITAGATLIIDTTAPLAPENVVVVAGTLGALNLSWQPPANETGTVTYRVYRNSAEITDVTGLTPFASGLTSTSHVDTPPADGEWFYAVVAVDEAGNVSPVSGSASGFSDQTPPEPPADLVASVTGDVVTLTWTAPAEPGVTYAVYRATTTFGGSVAGATPIAIDLVTTTANDTPGYEGDFFYVVVTLDSVGLSSVPSNEATARVDTRAPRITVGGVENDRHYAAAVTPLITIEDLTLASSTITLDGSAFTSGTEVSDEGPHVLEVVATDGANQETRVTISFVIDLTAPEVSITGVTEGTVYTDPPRPTLQASDTNLASSSMTLNDAPFSSGASVNVEGTWRAVATARDRAGNSATATVNFSVDLPPPPVPWVHAVSRSDGISLTWAASQDPSTTGYRVTRDGVIIDTSSGTEAVLDEPVGDAVVRLGVQPIDARDAVGGTKVVDVVPVRLVLADYGNHDADGAPFLTHHYFDQLLLQLVNPDIDEHDVGPLDIKLFDYEENERLNRSGTSTFNVAQLQTLAVTEVVPTHEELVGENNRINLRLTLPGTLTASAEYELDAPITGRYPNGVTAEAVHQSLVRGTEVTLRARIHNRGSADMDLIVARGTQPSDEIELRLRHPDGTVLASAFILDTALGVVKNGARVVTVRPGESITTMPVRIVIPNTAPDNVILETAVLRVHHQFGTDDAQTAPGFVGSRAVNVSPPAYLATATADKEEYHRGETVLITGVATWTADSTPAANVVVKIVLSNNGFKQVYFARTRDDGTYALPFVPAPAQAGVFTIGAMHPTVVVDEEDDTFLVHGIDLTPTLWNLAIVQGFSEDAVFKVKNIGATPMTEIAVALTDDDPADGVTATMTTAPPASLAPGASATMVVRVSASALASGSPAIGVTLTNTQGATRQSRIQVTLLVPQPAPRLTPTYLQLSMQADSQIVRTISVTNQGEAPWRDVTISPPATPAWVGIPTGTSLGDVDPGEVVTFDIMFRPPSGTNTDVYNGEVTLTSSNLVNQRFPFSVRVTDNEQGNADIKAFNAVYLLTDPGRPIEGATISLQSQKVWDLSYTQTTAADGWVHFTGIAAGRYTYYVRARGFRGGTYEGAIPDTGTILIEPDGTATLEIGLVESFVDVQWSVTPTTIQDSYDITIETTFETSVPVPVIEVVPARQTFDLLPGETATGQIEVFNLGLVSSFDFQLNWVQDHYLDIQYAFTHIPEIPARSSIVIPFTVYLRPHGSPPPEPCTEFKITSWSDWKWFCTTGGYWEQRQTNEFEINVVSHAAKVSTSPNPIVRTTIVGCEGFLDTTPVLPDGVSVTNLDSTQVSVCNCGRVTTAGIGLPTFDSLLGAFKDKVNDKLGELRGKVLQATGVGSWDDVLSGAADDAGLSMYGDDWDAIKDAPEQLEQLRGYAETAEELVEQAMQLASDCEDASLSESINAAIETVATEAADVIMNKALERVTGGILSFEKAYTKFDKTCLDPGESATSEVPGQAHSFGLGTMNFDVAKGCGPGAGSCCPVSITYVDYTVTCGDGTVSSSQSAGGGGGGGGNTGGGGGGGFGGGGTSGGAPGVGGACQ